MSQFQIKKFAQYSGAIGWAAAAIVTIFSAKQVLGGSCAFLKFWPYCSSADNAQSIIQGGTVLLIVGLFIFSGYYLFNSLLVESQALTLSRMLIVAISLLGAFLLLPFTSFDLQYYFSAGKTVLAGINPYVTNWPIEIPFYAGKQSFSQGIMYGPLSVDLFALVVALAKNSVLAFIVFWKMMLLGVFAAVGYLVQKKSTLPKANFWFFWLLQPLFLWEWIGNGHFDGIWVAFLLLAMLAAEKSRWWLVGLCLTLGIWIKFIPLLTLPWFALWWWQELTGENWKRRAGEMLATLGLAGLATVWFWQPYWVGFSTLKPMIIQSKWAVSSIFYVAYYSVSPLMQTWLGENSHYYLTRIVHGLLFVILVYLLYPYIKAAMNILLKKLIQPSQWYSNAIFVTLLAYLLVWQKSFWPWYPLWLIPLGLMIYIQSKNKYLKRIVSWLSLAPLIFYIPWMFYDGDLATLWFFWFVVVAIIAYPLVQLFIWRKHNFELA